MKWAKSLGLLHEFASIDRDSYVKDETLEKCIDYFEQKRKINIFNITPLLSE